MIKKFDFKFVALWLLFTLSLTCLLTLWDLLPDDRTGYGFETFSILPGNIVLAQLISVVLVCCVIVAMKRGFKRPIYVGLLTLAFILWGVGLNYVNSGLLSSADYSARIEISYYCVHDDNGNSFTCAAKFIPTNLSSFYTEGWQQYSYMLGIITVEAVVLCGLVTISIRSPERQKVKSEQFQ